MHTDFTSNGSLLYDERAMEDNQRISNYVQDQIARAEQRARAYVFDESGKKRPQRNAFIRLQMHLRDFGSRKPGSIRWIAISGLRGTGKTTLMAQLYCTLSVPRERKLFISADHIVQLLSSSVNEVVGVYEEILGQSLESLQEPVYLFIDEVHYDPKWAIALKVLFDRAPSVFLFTTGSSALEINMNQDAARRVVNEILLPMSFTEYQKISINVFEQKGLASYLRDALLNSQNAIQICELWKIKTSEVTAYWSRIERLSIRSYLEYGTLPFMAVLKNPALAFDQLERSLDRVIGGDVLKIGKFTAENIERIPQVLYALADSDVVSVNSLSKTLAIPRPTLERILDALVQAEILYRLEANTGHTPQLRTPDKFLFTTPAIRAMFYSLTGSTRGRDEDGSRGRLWEDLVAMYLRRLVGERSLTTSITYGDHPGEADFIVRHKQQTFVIEVGSGRKTTRQILGTEHVPPTRIGLLIANKELAVDRERNVVTLPLQFFLLL